MTLAGATPLARPAGTTSRPTETELEAAALILARELRAHLVDGLSHGRLAAVLSVGRSAEHLVGLVGPRAAEAAFAAACRET